MNTHASNPFYLFKQRTYNELINAGIQYVLKYKKSFLLPIILVAVPAEMVAQYIYLDSMMGSLEANPFSGKGLGSDIFLSLGKSFLFLIFLFLTHSISLSIIYSHTKIHALSDNMEEEKNYQEIISMGFRNLGKSAISILMTIPYILILIFLLVLPILLLVTIGNIMRPVTGGFLALFLSFPLILFMLPPVSYVTLTMPYVLMTKSSQENIYNAVKRIVRGLLKNFWKSWLFSLVVLIMLYVLQTFAYLPMLLYSITGLFGKPDESISNLVYTFFSTIFTSFLLVIISNFTMVEFLFLYGANEEEVSAHSIKKEIESM